MTNARYQRTRPMTNGRAPEQPHYAVITEDGWPSAPPPLPPCAGNGSPSSGSTLPGGSQAASRPPITAGQAGSGEPMRLPAAEEQSGGLSGSRGRTGRPACPRPGHAAVRTHGLHTRQPPVSLHHAPAAPVQAQPPPPRTMDSCFRATHGRTSATRSGYTPTNRNRCVEPCIPLHLQFMHTPTETTYFWAHVCSKHTRTCMDNKYTRKQKCVCVWTQALTHSSAHNSGPSHTKDTNSCLHKY